MKQNQFPFWVQEVYKDLINTWHYACTWYILLYLDNSMHKLKLNAYNSSHEDITIFFIKLVLLKFFQYKYKLCAYSSATCHTQQVNFDIFRLQLHFEDY